MAKERINGNMSVMEMVIAMAEGNPGAVSTMVEMITKEPTQGFLDILWFDTMGIYGAKIYMLWNDCCGRDTAKLFQTIAYLRSGKVSREEIHENLNRVRAVPFI